MYLINTNSMKLESFIDVEHCPEYVILSHRWTDDELTFKDFVKGRRKDSVGYLKVLDFCKLAQRDGFEWAWVDTCCIDKRSSAELQESINSMFRYYRRGRLCYVHLVDVTVTPADATFEEEFQQTQWFTRGWTLQELLAPSKIEFYSKDWTSLGRFGRFVNSTGTWYPTAQDSSFRNLVSRASCVPQEYLAGEGSIFDCSVACRMSWAAKRETTRGEDAAYCLLGLFQVNIPLLYGEGKQRAFLRLQEAIMKVSDDHTLLAWTLDHDVSDDRRSSCHGLLADEPAQFLDSRDISPSQPRRWADAGPFELTSHGLKITLPLLYYADDVYLARLDCEAAENLSEPTIVLRKISNSEPIFQRIFCGGLTSARGRDSDWTLGTIYVQQFQNMYDQVWRAPKEFFVLDPTSIGPYQLQMSTCTSSSGNVSNVRRSQLAHSESGFLCRGLLDSRSATLHLKHSTTKEELTVTLSAISRYFVGFNAHLSGTPALPDPRHTKVTDQYTDTKNDPFEMLTGDSLTARPEVCRLGSEIRVPSRHDKRWCHRVKLGIKSIHEYGPDKRYTLHLDLVYERITDNGGVGSDYHVIAPSGFHAEILRQPSSVTLLRSTHEIGNRGGGDDERRGFRVQDMPTSRGLATHAPSSSQVGVGLREWARDMRIMR